MKLKKVLGSLLATMMVVNTVPTMALDAGWNQVGNDWVYVNEEETKATGWLKVDGCWYFFNEDGTMHTGWLADGDHWYYMGPSGVMQTGAVLEVEGKTYYMKSNGLMAKDFVKDGIEYDENGVGTPIEENGSVIYDGTELPEVIEGNLYITDEFDEVALEGITVTGKIIIQSEKQIPVSVSLNDVTASEIVVQARNSEVEIDKESEITTVVVEESATITGKGSVDTLEVQSSATKETVIDVKANEVEINTYGTVVIERKVGTVTVDNDADLVVNAKVGTVEVTENANESTIEIADGKTVGTIVADAPVSIDGKGTINKIDAKVDGVTTGDDTYVNNVVAGEGVEKAPVVNEKPVVIIPVIPSYTLVKNESDLVAALVAGKKVKLGSDVEVATVIVIPEGVISTLDLSGYKLFAGWKVENTRHHYAIDNYGTFTLKDSVGTGIIEARGVENFGTMVMDGGTIKVLDSNGGAGVWNEGNLTINGGTLTTVTVNTSGPTALNNRSNGTVVINGGTLEGNASLAYAVASYGQLTVTEGADVTVTGRHGALGIAGGSASIAGGTYTCTDIQPQSDHVIYSSESTVTITGGTFIHQNTESGGKVLYETSTGNIEASGGTYSHEPDDSVLADGYKAEQKGSNWVVVSE